VLLWSASRRLFYFLFATEDQKEGMDAFVKDEGETWRTGDLENGSGLLVSLSPVLLLLATPEIELHGRTCDFP
jgi:hypothetical protein